MELGGAARYFATYSLERGHIMLTTILIIVLILALVGALPTWGYSRDWGYGPGGGLGLILSSSWCWRSPAISSRR
jgi:hypothetical protein